MLALIESALMYPAPSSQQGDWSPDWLEFEEAFFQTELGNTVHGWFCEHHQPRAVILICHGNGEHVAYMAKELEFLRERYQCSVMAFDYRGYGKSTGRPFEEGVLADGEAAVKWLANRTGLTPDSIVLWGRSLGGAVAVHIASKIGARGLVLDRTFNSMVDVAACHYPWLPVRWLLSNRYPSEIRIRAYAGPLIQFHGKRDEIVPFSLGARLFDAAPSLRKQFVASEVLTHNEPWPEPFHEAVEQFIDDLR